MQTSSATSVRRGATYSIRSGDTLWAIASRLKAQGISGSHAQIIRQIQQLNPQIKNPNLIYAGHALRLPGSSSVSASRDTFSPTSQTGTRPGSISPSVVVPQSSSAADAFRARVAQWAIAQADNQSIGYSQTKGRMGNVTDSSGHRYFDCSGLVYTAYRQAGVTLGGNWTGAMRSTWPQWADQVPKNTNAMKPGDLILMNGHVVMYIGNGRCVGAQTSHTAFADQVTTNINAQSYLNRSDAIVLRPRVPSGLV